MKETRKKTGVHSLPVVILSDIVITALALVIFAYFHHVRPSEYDDLGVVSYRKTAPVLNATPAPALTSAAPETEIALKPTASPKPDPSDSPDPVRLIGPFNTPSETEPPESISTFAPDAFETPKAAQSDSVRRQEPTLENIELDPAEPTKTPTVQPLPLAEGDFSLLHADKFIDGDPIETVSGDEYTYVSRNVNISVTSGKYLTGEYMLADVYVRDITNIATAFAEEKFGKGHQEWTQDIGTRHGAILSINGDYCGSRENGAVIRNGVLYRDRHSNLDVCVLYWDGTMKTFSPATSDARKAMEEGAYQAWSFGPRLLDDDGQPLETYNSNVNKYNPRTAIGYFSPGHYCFLVVRGRAADSRGLRMEDLAQLMCNLGCKVAYNLDGGKSSVMAWRDTVINDPYEGGRRCSDIVMIVD